jgi:hypothetical protein
MSHALTLPADAAGYDPDLALVLAAKAEPDSFSALYERYLARVYRYLAARAATPDEAADFSSAMEARMSFSDEIPEKTMLDIPQLRREVSNQGGESSPRVDRALSV